GSAARRPQSGDSGRSTKVGGLSVGGGQIRKTVPNPHSGNCRTGGGNRGLKLLNPGFTVRPPFPAPAIIGNRTQLSRVRPAAPNCGAPLTARSGSQEKSLRRGKGGRWDFSYTRSCPAAHRFASDPPAVPRLPWDCTKEVCLPMCLFVCFEAGWFTQTQSSRTVVSRSRKWMSGHAGYAEALAQSQTDPFRQITATVTPSTIALREILPLGPGRGLFSLDKSLSWMSHPGRPQKPMVRPTWFLSFAGLKWFFGLRRRDKPFENIGTGHEQ